MMDPSIHHPCRVVFFILFFNAAQASVQRLLDLEPNFNACVVAEIIETVDTQPPGGQGGGEGGSTASLSSRL